MSAVHLAVDVLRGEILKCLHTFGCVQHLRHINSRLLLSPYSPQKLISEVHLRLIFSPLIDFCIVVDSGVNGRRSRLGWFGRWIYLLGSVFVDEVRDGSDCSRSLFEGLSEFLEEGSRCSFILRCIGFRSNVLHFLSPVVISPHILLLHHRSRFPNNSLGFWFDIPLENYGRHFLFAVEEVVDGFDDLFENCLKESFEKQLSATRLKHSICSYLALAVFISLYVLLHVLLFGFGFDEVMFGIHQSLTLENISFDESIFHSLQLW